MNISLLRKQKKTHTNMYTCKSVRLRNLTVTAIHDWNGLNEWLGFTRSVTHSAFWMSEGRLISEIRNKSKETYLYYNILTYYEKPLI